VKELQESRGRLAEELVTLTTRNNELAKKGSRAGKLEAKCKDLQRRYMGALEMAGEKEEELEAIRGELSQVKEVFRGQVVDLMQQLQAAQTGA